MRIGRDEAERLMAKRNLPGGQIRVEERRFEVFVPGKVKNFLNGPQHLGWKVIHGYRQRWRRRLEAIGTELAVRGWSWSPAHPKKVYLLAHTHNRFDWDGLYAALKPIVDGLIDAGFIDRDDSSPDNPHVIEYDQKIDRKNRGVLVRVEAAR